jgi:hypothetical protein
LQCTDRQRCRRPSFSFSRCSSPTLLLVRSVEAGNEATQQSFVAHLIEWSRGVVWGEEEEEEEEE